LLAGQIFANAFGCAEEEEVCPFDGSAEAAPELVAGGSLSSGLPSDVAAVKLSSRKYSKNAAVNVVGAGLGDDVDLAARERPNRVAPLAIFEIPLRLRARYLPRRAGRRLFTEETVVVIAAIEADVV